MAGEHQRGDGTGSAAASVLTILEGMRGAGIDVDAVCAASGLSLVELETREEPVPPAQLGAMWREGTRLYGAGTIGMAVALAAQYGRLIVDYVASTSTTLRQGLEQVIRYHRLVTRNGDMRLQPAGELTLFELLFNLPAALIPPQVVEYALTSIVRRAREFTGKNVREVWLPHAPQGPREEYLRLLRIPVRFESERTGVLLDDEALDAPCVGHDPNLYRLLRSHADLLLARERPPDGSTLAQARPVVIGLLAQGEPELGAAARRLATSGRSLQRRLQAEGSSFRQLVEDVRRELAEGYLGDRRLSVAEVAYLLGYAEAGAFVRAFRRWTGQTPGQAREMAATNAQGAKRPIRP